VGTDEGVKVEEREERKREERREETGREKRGNGKREERREKRGLSNLCVEKIIYQQIQF
jgi:hypothetical protein